MFSSFRSQGNLHPINQVTVAKLEGDIKFNMIVLECSQQWSKENWFAYTFKGWPWRNPDGSYTFVPLKPVGNVFCGPPELTEPYRTAFARYYTKYGFRNLVTLVGWRPRLKQLFDEKLAAAKAKEARTKAKPKPKPTALKRKAKAVETAKSSCSLS
jgi:hypothetical protein